MEDSLFDKVGRAFKIFLLGNGTPIIPVEAIKISFGLIESSCESRDATDLQSFIPFGPLQALAFPLLTTMARNVFELPSTFRHQVTVGETILFAVNTPAATAGSSEKISARSFCLLVFIPQEIPDAVKPGTRNPCFTVVFSMVNIFKEKYLES